jgi:predicted RNase H-like nuclease (RuvC/YqgF family)
MNIGYVFPSTTTVPMTQQVQWNAYAFVGPKITALENRIAKLEAENAEMRAKGQALIDQLEALLEDVRKRELAEDEERTCNSAGGILGRAISKHW